MGGESSKNSAKHNPNELHEQEIDFLLKLTHFNRKEIIEWHKGFIKECPKGKIDKKSFVEVFKDFYPAGKVDKFCGYLFKSFDINNSGEIDFTEFLMAMSVTSRGDLKEKLIMAFKMYDIDKNNTIDKKEMEKLFEAIYDLLGEENRKGENSIKHRVKRIMEKLDKNHDGVLTQDEFVIGCMQDESLRKLLVPTSNT